MIYSSGNSSSIDSPTSEGSGTKKKKKAIAKIKTVMLMLSITYSHLLLKMYARAAAN
jgi:hypothetical protein